MGILSLITSETILPFASLHAPILVATTKILTPSHGLLVQQVLHGTSLFKRGVGPIDAESIIIPIVDNHVMSYVEMYQVLPEKHVFLKMLQVPPLSTYYKEHGAINRFYHCSAVLSSRRFGRPVN